METQTSNETEFGTEVMDPVTETQPAILAEYDPYQDLADNIPEPPATHQAATLDEIRKVLAQLEALKKPAKNHVAGKARNLTYVLMSQKLADWGKVPQQQADLAKILADNLEVGKPVPESEVFAIVEREAAKYPSLAKSVQHPTYLLRYYRGLKHEGKHAGFVARGFVRVN